MRLSLPYKKGCSLKTPALLATQLDAFPKGIDNLKLCNGILAQPASLMQLLVHTSIAKNCFENKHRT